MVQNRTGLLLRRLRIDRAEFITDIELHTYCKSFNLDYSYVSRYLMRKGVLIRVFRGIFYMKSLDELETGHTKYNHLELVAKGMELKGVKDWYYGLYTALRLNEMTHEHFAIEYVISGKILRLSPMTIASHRFQFTKINPRLTLFGIKKQRSTVKSVYIKYSDPEKTILDFIYLWRYEGLPQRRIKMDLQEWASDLDATQIKSYSKSYPKTVQRTLMEELL